MLKLLIISLSAGAGHVRAAEAVRKTAELYFPNIQATHIDLADYTTFTLRRTVISSYAMMVKTMPEIYGFLYDQANKPKNTRRLNRLTKLLKRMNSARFYRYLRQERPDAILCTHCLASDIILNAPKKYQFNAPVSVAVTDYDLHNLWIVPGTNHYFVATEKMKWKMEREGVPEEKITVSGIPIQPVLFEEKKESDLRKKYQIPANKRVVLVLSGGQGLGKSNKIVETLFTSSQPMAIIAIAGKNAKLEEQLKNYQPPAHIDFHPVGWTRDVDEYLRLADVVVTKPGGITTTECLTLGKPIIAVDPIPGQEEHNAEFILSHGFGQIARGPADLLYYIEHPFTCEKAKMRNAAEIILNKLNNL
jgi:processive 1,2-diacylglycerol beta-glucosyltransferase